MMQIIEIREETLERMRDHARRTYPDECCGAIFGSDTGEERRVLASMEIDNTAGENRRRRFSIAPRDYLRAEREAERLGMRLLGFYHSHPDHPAHPSQTDRTFAQPGFSYPILASTRCGVAGITSWRLPDPESWYEEEMVRTLPRRAPGIAAGAMTLLW